MHRFSVYSICICVLQVMAAFGDMPKGKPLTKAGPSLAVLTKLTVFPKQISLDGPRDEHRLVVLGEYADGNRWDLTRQVSFTSSAPKIAKVEKDGVVHPAGNGKALVTIQLGNLRTNVPVKVQHASADTPVQFTREVVPVLTKLGCNQGACHGAQHGRGGFRLSLLGYDPTFDFPQIIQSAEGRRVVLSDPERSIFLLKPSLQMEHGGGERFKIHSKEYQLLKSWLEDGAPEPNAKDPTVTAIEVWPVRRVMQAGQKQQLLVRATWSDGKTNDVTAIAQFDTLNEGVAQVSPAGLITAKGKGETHIMVRFAGQATVMQVTLPFARLTNYPRLAQQNFIDGKLIAKWKDLGLTPSRLCSDEEFIRRAYLDTIGTLPTRGEVKAFLADQNPRKRETMIDKVLVRPEFIDYWALKWGDLLRINRDFLSQKGMWSFHNWVRAALRDQKPVDEMARDIITAEGSTFTEGPANFFLVGGTPSDWAETTTQVFLGTRIQCAKCHHHPFEKWSQDDYYGMTAFFVRLGTKGSQEFGVFGRERIIFLRPSGETRHPRTGAIVKPHPLGGEEMDDKFDRRRQLAAWVTAKNNLQFARNIVNRFWGYYMGRGLVEPLDDMRATNPASNPELLDALAADFVKNRYSMKHLLKTIMRSRAYQLSSTKSSGNETDTGNVFYARYSVKRLTAEQLADAIDFATGTREKYQGLPLGTRAIQLPDPGVRSFLLDIFGRPARQVVCECERTVQPNISQALHLLNGNFLNRKISTPSGRLEKLIKRKATIPQMIEELYLVTLSRPPRLEEAKKAERWVKSAPTPREGAQDLLWVLLNSREFLFNH